METIGSPPVNFLVNGVHMLEYVAILRDLRNRTTIREYFRAEHYLAAKELYKSRGNVESKVGPVAIEIVGVGPVSVVRPGQVVTLLNPDNSIGNIGHVVTAEEARGTRYFFE